MEDPKKTAGEIFEAEAENIEAVTPVNEPKAEAEAISAESGTAEEEVVSFAGEGDLEDNVKVISPIRLVMKRFFRSKLSVAGLVMLIVLFLFAFLGPLFSPYGETQATGDFKWVQSVVEHKITVEEDGEFVTYTFYEVSDAYKVYSKTPPSSKHWLGTDQYGYDVFTRLMYGGRVSLLLGFIVVFAEMLLGTVIGAFSGYFGKWVDQVIMRIVDIFNCLPSLPILMLASSMLETWGVPAESKIYALMGILTIFGWSGTARLVRGQILSLREQEFMLAAEATGISTARKVFKHLIPNVLPLLIVQATLGLGSVILYESTLSYLGLGVPFPYAAWGTMIGATSGAAGKDILENYPNLWVPAGICIILAVLAFNFVGDGLRDAFDPKAKR